MGYQRWTAEETEQLKAMVGARASANRIVVALRRSIHSVYGPTWFTSSDPHGGAQTSEELAQLQHKLGMNAARANDSLAGDGSRKIYDFAPVQPGMTPQA
ncbi:hypothetical protein BraRD5C2_38390 [Bradyrhizobium sp. RD5-C2]|nr:hypothetical protein BraRD5C2_38390 [Bradyrhizobium sp. RD5-C2]